MFTPHDLYRAFRDEFWPEHGKNPALTHRLLDQCSQQPDGFAIAPVSYAIVAVIHVRDETGAEHAAYRLYADPRSIERRGLSARVKIGVRTINGRYAWHTIACLDCVARFNLGDLIPGLEQHMITLPLHQGTTEYAVVLAPDSGMTEGLASNPNDAGAAPADDLPALARAERRINAALAQADTVTRSALRRHLAKVAHSDTVPLEERQAFDTALGKAFGQIDQGHFAFKA